MTAGNSQDVTLAKRKMGNIENLCQCVSSLAKDLVSRIAGGKISAAVNVLIDRIRQSDCPHAFRA